MAKQMSDFKGIQHNQLKKKKKKIKEELIDVILATNNEKVILLEIKKKLTEVINELESLESLVTSPESATNKKRSLR